MKLAFSRFTDSDEGRDILFKNFRSKGFEGLQLKPAQYVKYLDSPQQFLDEWGATLGNIAALITGGFFNDKKIAEVKKIIKFASSVNADIIVLCLDIPKKESTPEIVKNVGLAVAELGRESQQSGVKLSVHHHYNSMIMYPEDLDIFFDATKGTPVGLTVDTAHLDKTEITDQAGFIRKFKSLIDNFHLQDNKGLESLFDLGHGNVDFDSVFSVIKEIGFNGWAGVSIDNQGYVDIIKCMEGCAAFVKKGLGLQDY